MDWNNKNIFITGADGFIGGWVAKTLVDKGANVIVVARDDRKGSALKLHKIIDKVTLVKGDVTDYSLMRRIINEYEIEYVFHFAAQAIVSIANSSPLSTFETNIKGTWTILEAVRNANYGGFKGIIVASTDKAYGIHEQLPYTEESELKGIYPYDASKACADIIARSYAKMYDMPVAVTRKSNIYGGGDLNFSRIVPRAISWLERGTDFVVRGGGSSERDYLYVEDAVAGYLALAENLHRNEIKGEAFNFSTNKPVSVLEMVKAISMVLGKDKEPFIEQDAPGEIDRQYLANEKAQRLLGWQPKHDLDEGLCKTAEWYRKFFSEQEVIN